MGKTKVIVVVCILIVGGGIIYTLLPEMGINIKIDVDVNKTKALLPTIINKTKSIKLSPIDEEALALKVHEKVNEVRVAHGLPPLEYDEDLAKMAKAHSEDMKTRNYFDHVTPDGKDVDVRALEFGIPCAVGENILMYENADVGLELAQYRLDGLAEDIVKSWLESPGHRENILYADYYAEGIGIATTPTGILYATEDFCLLD